MNQSDRDPPDGLSPQERASDPAPSRPYRPPFWPLITFLSALVLFGCLVFLTWLQISVPPLERVAMPERALLLLVSRTMELEGGLAHAPAWERLLYDVTTQSGSDEITQAIAWYEELAASSQNPLAQLFLIVLEGEAGRLERVREKVTRWALRSAPFPSWSRLIRAAYLDRHVDLQDEQLLQAQLAEVLPAGWFYDQLAIRLAERAGDIALLAASREARAARAAPLLSRLRVLTLVELTLIGLGTVSLVMMTRRRRARLTVGTAPIPPPWRGRVGVAVLIRGGALGIVLTMAFLLVDLDDPLVRLIAMPVAGVPLFVLARRHLLTPAGLSFADGFGLTCVPGGWSRLVPAVMALLAAGLLGEWSLGLLAERVDLSSHWTEWFDADLVWGEHALLIVSLVEFVVLAPVLEEVVFRGLLFGTLRRRFRWPASALLSAALFAGAHGYGVLGFASVVWSGVLWAWMYEKTGSLLPGMIAHAVNNLLVCLAILFLLRY